MEHETALAAHLGQQAMVLATRAITEEAIAASQATPAAVQERETSTMLD